MNLNMNNNLTLNENIINTLASIFNDFEEVNEVILYGSRAKDTHHSRSDIDLVIKNSKLDRQSLGKIKYQIDNSDIPFLVDLQILEKIKNKQLLDHIQRVGKLFYKRV